MKSISRLCAVVAMLAGAACASAGGAGVAQLSWDVGVGTAQDVQSVPLQTFERSLYRMERTSGPPNLMMQTFWRDRPVFDDERAAGYSEARTRFILEGRPRLRNPEGGGELYTVQVRAENMGRLATGGDWMTMPPTPEFRDYASDIAELIRADLLNRTRIR